MFEKIRVWSQRNMPTRETFERIGGFDQTFPFAGAEDQDFSIRAREQGCELVIDRDNPRSLGWVAQLLRGRLARLAGGRPGEISHGSNGGALSLMVPNTDLWELAALCGTGPEQAGVSPQLAHLLQLCCDSAYNLSDAISAQYFTHSDARHSIGT